MPRRASDAAKEGKPAGSKEVEAFIEVETRVSQYVRHLKDGKRREKAARKEVDALADATAAARALNGDDQDEGDCEGVEEDGRYNVSDGDGDVLDETARELKTGFHSSRQACPQAMT